GGHDLRLDRHGAAGRGRGRDRLREGGGGGRRAVRRAGRVRRAFVVAMLLSGGARGAEEPARVVFVCEHGNVKSLIASRWFDRLAAERGLALRSTSRGLTPEPQVPEAIARHLGEDG